MKVSQVGLRLTLARQLSDADARAYDAFVASAAGTHWTQARAFLPVVVAGKHVQHTHILISDGDAPIAAALVLRPSFGRVAAPFAYVERGPVVAQPEHLGRVLPALAHALRRRGVARLHVMPYLAGPDLETAKRALASARFRDVQAPSGAHARTLRVELAGKKADEVLAGGEREALRRKLKRAEKEGISVRRGAAAEVLALAELHRNAMTVQGLHAKPPAYFEALAELAGTRDDVGVFAAEHDEKILSVVLAVHHGSLATFVVGAASPEARAFSKTAPAMARALRWAHERGAAAFDLGGIPLENDTDPKRAAIAQFKLDFAKTPVDLVHEHARWF